MVSLIKNIVYIKTYQSISQNNLKINIVITHVITQML